MHILLTGGSGLIGRALCRHWLAAGHRLTVWSRTPERIPGLCGSAVRGIGDLHELDQDVPDAVVIHHEQRLTRRRAFSKLSVIHAENLARYFLKYRYAFKRPALTP